MDPPCRWEWDGTQWVPSQKFPHSCPPGQSCSYPEGTGTYIGEEIDTACQSGDCEEEESGRRKGKKKP